MRRRSATRRSTEKAVAYRRALRGGVGVSLALSFCSAGGALTAWQSSVGIALSMAWLAASTAGAALDKGARVARGRRPRSSRSSAARLRIFYLGSFAAHAAVLAFALALAAREDGHAFGRRAWFVLIAWGFALAYYAHHFVYQLPVWSPRRMWKRDFVAFLKTFRRAKPV